MTIRRDNLSIAQHVAKTKGLKAAIQELVDMKHEAEIFIMVDGVLADFPDHFFTYLGLPRDPLESMEDKRLMLNYYKINGDNDFWLTIPPYEKIDGLPVTTYVIARHPDQIPVTEKWLRFHGYPDAPLLNLFHADKLSNIPRSAFFLEDDVASYERLKHKGVRVFLIDRPWNQNFETIDRVYSVAEFYERIFRV